MLIGEKTALGDIVSAYWPVLAAAFVVTLLATPVCRRVALARKLVDRPDDFLKPHDKPIPYLGGVAIFLGWAVGVGLSVCLFASAGGEALGGRVPHTAPTIDRTMMLGILVAGAATMMLGLFDDLRVASPKTKLLGVTLVTVLLMFVGLGDDTIVVALRSTRLQPDSFPYWLTLCYSVPLTLFITLGACNATNLLDGIDGLCGGVLGIISVGLLVLAIHLHTWGEWYVWDAQRVTLCLAMLGAALGFLPYNRNPAKIFRFLRQICGRPRRLRPRGARPQAACVTPIRPSPSRASDGRMGPEPQAKQLLIVAAALPSKLDTSLKPGQPRQKRHYRSRNSAFRTKKHFTLPQIWRRRRFLWETPGRCCWG